MRSNEERLAALHARAAELKSEKRTRRVAALQAVSACLCLAAVIALALAMPGLATSVTAETAETVMRASLFAGSSALGYIVVGVVAFLLGAAGTVFCFRLKKWRADKDKGDGRS